MEFLDISAASGENRGTLIESSELNGMSKKHNKKWILPHLVEIMMCHSTWTTMTTTTTGTHFARRTKEFSEVFWLLIKCTTIPRGYREAVAAFH